VRRLGEADILTASCEPIVWTLLDPQRLTTSRPVKTIALLLIFDFM
jgi:hypothetical protein